jgi:voltage-gated potassium channel
MPRPRPLSTLLAHTTIVVGLLTVGYYVAPLRNPFGDSASAVRLAAGTVLLAGVVLKVRTELLRGAAAQFGVAGTDQLLLSALYLLLLVFAVTYFVVARTASRQFVGIHDRMDARCRVTFGRSCRRRTRTRDGSNGAVALIV